MLTLYAAVFLRPLASQAGTHLGPGLGDPLFNLVVLKWDAHRLEHGLTGLWSPPYFYPTRDALALSDHLLGPGAVAWGITAATGNPVLAYNLLLFSAFVVTGLATHLVFRAAGLGRAAAFLAALAYAFSPFRLGQTPHLQMLLAAAIPPLLWFWHRFLVDGRRRDGLLALGLYAVHLSGGTYLAYMVHLPLLVTFLVHAGHGAFRGPSGRRRLVATGALGLAMAVLACGTFYPYVTQRTGSVLERDEWDLRSYGATLAAWLTPSYWNTYFPWAEGALAKLHQTRPGDGWVIEKNLFPGFVPAALALVALRSGRRRWSGWRPAYGPWGVVLAAAAAVAAFLAADLYTCCLAVERGADSPGLLRPGRFYDLCLVVFLAAAATVLWRHRGRLPAAARAAGPPTFPRVLLAASAICLLLSFPLFFEPLSDRLPGLGGMRVPARFYVFTSLGVAWLAGRGFELVLAERRFRASRAAVGTAVVLACAVELVPVRLPFEPVPQESRFPGVDHWLARQPEVRAYLDLPFGDTPDDEILPMYRGSLHFKPLVNGYSGHLPPDYLALRRICCTPVPEKEALQLLRSWGVTHVVVRLQPALRRRPQALRRYQEWRERVLTGELRGVQEVYSDHRKDRVYAIAP